LCIADQSITVSTKGRCELADNLDKHTVEMALHGLTKEQHDALVKFADQNLTPKDLVGHIQATLGDAMEGRDLVGKMKPPPPSRTA
jgi:hypothetical protein